MTNLFRAEHSPFGLPRQTTRQHIPNKILCRMLAIFVSSSPANAAVRSDHFTATGIRSSNRFPQNGQYFDLKNNAASE